MIISSSLDFSFFLFILITKKIRMAGHKIKLQSSDGDTFDVEVEIAKQSATIKTMLEGKIDWTFFFD